eukprot:jgi/Psemu1/16642/gm1.16642_g
MKTEDPPAKTIHQQKIYQGNSKGGEDNDSNLRDDNDNNLRDDDDDPLDNDEDLKGKDDDLRDDCSPISFF